MFKNKGQVWYYDLFFGIVIFILVFSIFMKSATNINDSEGETSKNLENSGKLFSNILLSEGYPNNWNSSSVVQIGLLTDERIDSRKLANLSSMNYTTVKNLFRLREDYYFWFENASGTITINGIEGYGKVGITESNLTSDSPNNLLRIVRLSVYDSQVVRMVICLW